jgi:hypothetical protein
VLSSNGISALRAISKWPEGVAALADTEVFEELQQVLAALKKYSGLAPLGLAYCKMDPLFEMRVILASVARYEAGKTDSVYE